MLTFVNMKQLLFLLFFALPLCAQTKAFTTRDNGVVWENVYVTDETDVTALLEKHPSLTITSHKGSMYKGGGKDVKNSCPGVSGNFADARYNFAFEIEKSSGMYRVTISNIKMMSASKGKAINIEKYLLEKGVLKQDAQTDKDISCLDALFNRMFTATGVFKNKP